MSSQELGDTKSKPPWQLTRDSPSINGAQQRKRERASSSTSNSSASPSEPEAASIASSPGRVKELRRSLEGRIPVTPPPVVGYGHITRTEAAAIPNLDTPSTQLGPAVSSINGSISDSHVVPQSNANGVNEERDYHKGSPNEVECLQDMSLQATARAELLSKLMSAIPPEIKEVFEKLNEMMELQKQQGSDTGDTVCEGILTLLRSLNRIFKFTDEQQLEATLQQLKRNDILISFFGRYNAGKSTLLNAIAADRFLPVSKRAQTSVMVKIKHRPSIHPGTCKQQPCQECPLLLECHIQEKATASFESLTDLRTRALQLHQGSPQILRRLKEIDKSRMDQDALCDEERSTTASPVAEKQMPSAKGELAFTELFIEAHVPVILDVQPPWNIYLVDNPGFGAAHDGINALAETAMKTSSAYVYTIPYLQIDGKEHRECFKSMYAKDKDVFTNNRLVVAVTHFDEYFEEDPDDPDVLSAESLKVAISNKIKKEVGISISHSQIVPLCGEWAFTARQLKMNPNDENQRKKAVKYLECYHSHGPLGQDRKFSAVPVKEMVRVLEEASGITQLEAQIWNMVSNCLGIWKKSIRGDCMQYISAAVKMLQAKAATIQSFTKDQEEQHRMVGGYQESVMAQWEQLQKSLEKTESNPIYMDFMRCYDKDLREALEVGRRDFEEFKQQCMQSKAMHPNELAQKIEEFLQKEERQLLDEQSFIHIYKHLATLGLQMGKLITDLWDAENKYCNCKPAAEPPTKLFQMIPVRGKGRDVFERRPNLLEIRNTIPQIQLPNEQTWLILIRMLFPRRVSGEELEQSFTKLEVEFEEKCCKYFSEIKPKVAEFFFRNGYQERAKMVLEVCSEVFEEPEASQDMKLSVEEEVIKKLKKAKRMLVQWWKYLDDTGKYVSQPNGKPETRPKPMRSMSLADHTRKSRSAPTSKPQRSKSTIHKHPRSPTTKNVPPDTRSLIRDKAKTNFKYRLWFERKKLSDEFDQADYKSDLTTRDFLSSCEVVAKRLSSFSQRSMYSDLISAFSADLLLKWKPFQKKKLYIGVFGCSGSEKNTLLNAMIADTVLPKCKTLRVLIKHDIATHRGPCPLNGEPVCEQCPSLSLDEGGRASDICKGSETISQNLQRSRNANVQPACHVVATSVPLLSSIRPWEVYLVDVPGFGELDHDKQETRRLNEEAKIVQAYIYCLPYFSFKPKQPLLHVKFLKQLIRRDESAFMDKRMIVAVTHFEEWYHDGPEKTTVDAVKYSVCEKIKDGTGVTVEKEAIIPVCGEWALTARQLQHGSRNEALKLKAIAFLKVAGSYAEGIEKLHPVEIASKLLAVSGILSLEKRIVAPMCKNSSDERHSGIVTTFETCLTSAVEKLEGHAEGIKEYIEERDEQYSDGMTDYAEYEKKRKALLSTSHHQSAVYQDISAQSFQDITDMVQTGMKKCEGHFSSFKDAATRQLITDPQKYGPETLRRDMSQLLETVSEVLLSQALDPETTFSKARKTCNDHSRLEFKSMERLARQFLTEKRIEHIEHLNEPDAAVVDIEKILQSVDFGIHMENVGAFLETLQQTGTDMQLTEEHIANITEQLKHAVGDKFRGCLESVQTSVVKEMFKLYHDRVSQSLQRFNLKYEQILETRKHELEELQEEAIRWDAQRLRIKNHSSHLVKLKKHLLQREAEFRGEVEEAQSQANAEFGEQ